MKRGGGERVYVYYVLFCRTYSNFITDGGDLIILSFYVTLLLITWPTTITITDFLYNRPGAGAAAVKSFFLFSSFSITNFDNDNVPFFIRYVLFELILLSQKMHSYFISLLMENVFHFISEHKHHHLRFYMTMYI